MKTVSNLHNQPYSTILLRNSPEMLQKSCHYGKSLLVGHFKSLLKLEKSFQHFQVFEFALMLNMKTVSNLGNQPYFTILLRNSSEMLTKSCHYGKSLSVGRFKSFLKLKNFSNISEFSNLS